MHPVALSCPARGHARQWQSGCMFHGGLPPPPTVSGVEKGTPEPCSVTLSRTVPSRPAVQVLCTRTAEVQGREGKDVPCFLEYRMLIRSQVRRVELITLEFKSWQSPALIMLSFHLSSLASVSSLPTGTDTNGLKCHASLENVCCHIVLLLIYTEPLCYEPHSFSYFHSLMTILLGICYAPGFGIFIRHLL